MKIQQKYTSIIFDLDGTLIDSSPSILKCFRIILENAGIEHLVPLDSSIIGPPLRQTLMNISGLSQGDQLERLAVDFQRMYDTEGFKETNVYSGVNEMLFQLDSCGIPMTIATNKRLAPTLKILSHLGWEHYFTEVGALDMINPSFPSKAALLGYLLEKSGKNPEAVLYIGDKHDDAAAAEANGMPFVAAGWGYGEWSDVSLPKEWSVVDAPLQLIEM